MITVQDLAHLAERLDALKWVAEFTPSTIDDAIVRILTIAAGDEVVLQALADFLNWIPIFRGDSSIVAQPEPELPSCLETERKGVENWRTYLRAKSA